MARGSANRDMTCVHCGKPFRAEVLSPESELAGVKCPHCKLFMPLERVETDADAA
jgi:DNA-directed RNA polymerase subunit RPC12/RpoP